MGQEIGSILYTPSTSGLCEASGAVAGQWSWGWGWEAHSSRQLGMHQRSPPCILLRMCLYRFSCFVSLSYNIEQLKDYQWLSYLNYEISKNVPWVDILKFIMHLWLYEGYLYHVVHNYDSVKYIMLLRLSMG